MMKFVKVSIYEFQMKETMKCVSVVCVQICVIFVCHHTTHRFVGSSTYANVSIQTKNTTKERRNHTMPYSDTSKYRYVCLP